MQFRPRHAGALLAFTFPVSVWLDKWREGETPPVPEPTREYVYIYRHSNTVKRVILSSLQYKLLTHLFNAASLENAIETTVSESSDESEELFAHIHLWIPEWITKGFFRL